MVARLCFDAPGKRIRQCPDHRIVEQEKCLRSDRGIRSLDAVGTHLGIVEQVQHGKHGYAALLQVDAAPRPRVSFGHDYHPVAPYKQKFRRPVLSFIQTPGNEEDRVAQNLRVQPPQGHPG